MDFRNIKQGVKQGLLLIGTLFIFYSATTQAAPPNTVDDLRTMLVNSVLTIDVLANDSDPDGDGLVLVSITEPLSGGEVAAGTAVINNDGGITYTPPQDFVGIVSFGYVVADTSLEGEQAQGLVTISVLDNPLSGAIENPNYKSVAQVIDTVCGLLIETPLPDTGVQGAFDLKARCEELLTLSDEEAAAVVQQIAPEETLSLSKVGNNATQAQSQVIGARLMQLGQGLGTASRGGLTWSKQPSGGAAGDGDSIMAKIGVFATVQLEDADKKRSEEEAGFEYSANGITVGADYAMNESWFLGGAFGYTTNDLNYSQAGGEVETTIYNFIAYSSYSHKSFTFDAQAGYGTSNIDIARRIAYNDVNISTAGSTNGQQWYLSGSAQYMYNKGGFSFYPSAVLNYSSSGVEAYADTDAGGWDILLGEQSTQKLAMEARLQSTYAMNMSWGVLIPNAEFNLIGNLSSSQDDVQGRFAYALGDTDYFTLAGEEAESLYYQVGIGFSFILPKGTSGFAGYQKTLGYQDFSASQFQAGFRLEF